MVDMETTTHTRTSCGAALGPLGPIGVASRVVVGLVFVAAALWWREPTLTDVVVGLVAMPAVATVALALRARVRPEPLDATSPTAHCLNVVLFLALFFIPLTAGGTFLFYGVSMFVAAIRREGGCEVTAIANAVLDRDDQVGCVLFGPIDAAEAVRR
jgi:hypothetical protein